MMSDIINKLSKFQIKHLSIGYSQQGYGSEELTFEIIPYSDLEQVDVNAKDFCFGIVLNTFKQ